MPRPPQSSIASLVIFNAASLTKVWDMAANDAHSLGEARPEIASPHRQAAR